MGLPYSLPLAALTFLMPDATQIIHNGYLIQNGTWKWGAVPQGEVGMAIQDSSQTYMVFSPEQFDEAYPPISNPTPTPEAEFSEQGLEHEWLIRKRRRLFN